MGFKRIHFLFDPHLARQVLGDPLTFVKNRFVYDKIFPVTGRSGMVQIEGEAGLKLRSAFNQFFNRDALDEYLESAQRVISQSIGDITGLRDAREGMTDMVLRTAIAMFIGSQPQVRSMELAGAFLRLNYLCGRRFRNLLPIPSPLQSLKIHRTQKKLDAAIREILDGETEAHSLIERIRREADGFPAEVTRQFLLDQVKTFLFAGHETTAAYLTMAVYELARHPELQEEIAHEFRDSEPGELIRRFLQEILRLYPPAWMIVRESTAEGELGGNRYRSGDYFFIGVYQMHRHEGHWKNPNQFDLENQESKNPALMPYGFGKRSCIGARLADMEVTMILKLLLKSYRLVSPDTHTNVRPNVMITAFPGNPVMVDFQPRDERKHRNE